MLLAAVFLAVWFGNLDYRKLIRPDEGRYAEISREMAVTGDWITPRLNGIKYFEKPPLQYWATAAAYRTFGEHEWTARLWSAITGFLGILLVLFAGRSLFGIATGFYASLILASSAGYVATAHFNALDMGLAFFLTATLLAYLLAQRPEATPLANRLWTLAAWAAAALAVLSKGLIGIVVPAAVLAIYVVLQRDFARLRGLHWGMGITVFLLIAAPWFVLVQLANPEFARFFFVHEHFERFLTTVHRRVEPWWIFFPILAIGMVPWLTAGTCERVAHTGAAHGIPASSFPPDRRGIHFCVLLGFELQAAWLHPSDVSIARTLDRKQASRNEAEGTVLAPDSDTTVGRSDRRAVAAHHHARQDERARALV
jgi:4-amino-4-deoxy-L-arabinose transferase-like glycosyltransferase